MFSSTVTAIDDSFWCCYNLTSLQIPANVTQINVTNWSVTCASALTEIVVDSNNKTYKSVNGVLFSKDMKTLLRYPVKKDAFTYEIPNGVTTIGISAFSNALLLKEITIPNSVTDIRGYAFYGCTKIGSIGIPSSVINMYTGVFSGWTASQEIILYGKLFEPTGWSASWGSGCSAKIYWGGKVVVY